MTDIQEDDGIELVRPSGETIAFDRALAEAYGIEEAILIWHFQYWIRINKTKKQNFIDGRTWTYQTYGDIALHFTLLSPQQVRRAINNLIGFGVIIKANYNKMPGDNTCWFAFNDESIYMPELCAPKKKPKEIPASENDTPPLSKSTDPCRNRQTPVEIDRAIPDTIPDNKPYKKTTNQGMATQVGGLVGGFLKDLEKKQEQHQGQKIYACLENIDIPMEAKIGFTSRFPEQIVINSVKHSTKPSTKINKSLEDCIATYCRNPQWITKSKEEIQAEKIAEADRIREAEQTRKQLAESIAHEVHKLHPPSYTEYPGIGGKMLKFANWLVKSESNRVEIHNPNNYDQKESIYFDDKCFRNKFEHFLRKFQLPIPALVAKLP